MPEVIINASGPQYGLVVNPDGSLNTVVSGINISIGSLALSLENVYVQSGDNIRITSMPKTEVYGSGTFVGSITSMPPVSVTAGSESWIKGGSIEVYNRVAGSIVDMPSLTGSFYVTNSINVSTGSEVYVKNFGDLGSSVVVENVVAGSIVSMPSVSVTAGSEQWIKNFGELGSSVVVTNFGDIGSNITGSVYVTNLGDISVNSGSESYVTNFGDLGSSRVITNRVAGSIVDMPPITGSVEITNGILPVSGTLFQDILGSVYVSNQISEITVGSESYVKAGSVIVTNVVAVSGVVGVEFSNDYVNVIQSGTNWGVSGNINVINRVAGSIVNMPDVVISSPSTIGSFTTQGITGSVAITNLVNPGSMYITNFGDVGSVAVQTITGNVGITGSIMIGSVSAFVDSVYIQSGDNISITNRVAGSIVNWPGSVAVSNFDAIGSNRVITNFNDIGSSRVITNFGELGSTRVISNFNDLGSSRVITNFNDLGSSVIVTNFGDLGSDRTISNMVAGSIVYMPDINVAVGSEQWIKNTVEVSGDVFQNILGSVYVSNQISEITVGSESYIKNWEEIGSSRVITNFGDLGSSRTISNRVGISGIVEVSNMVAGSIVYMPPVSVSVGSESWIKGGSVEIYGSNNIGSVVVSNTISVDVDAGSEVYVKNWNEIGSSIVVTNFGDLGSDRTISNMVAGSIVYMPSIQSTLTGSLEVFSSTGSVEIYGALSATAGSEVWVQNTVEVSGLIDINNFGNLGSSRVITNFNDLGSVVVVDNFGVLGSDRTISNRVAGSIVNLPDVVISNPATIGSYTTQNIAGTVTANTGLYAGSEVYQTETFGVSGIVEVSNLVAGSIVYMPAISVEVGSESYIKAGSVEVYNRVAGSIVNLPDSVGSIWSMPDINVSTGSEVWIKNYNEIGSSVVVTNFNDLGSSVVVTNLYAGSKVWQGEIFGISGIVAGSITSIPDINVSTGSEVWIQNTVEVSGLIDINNFNALGSSRVITNFDVIGSSRVITNFGDLGSDRTISNMVAGSIVYMPAIESTLTGSLEVFTSTGSVEIFGNISSVAGSEVWIKGGSILTYSGTNFVDVANFADLGSSVIVTNFNDLGSTVVVDSPQTIGSFTGMANGSIWFGGGVGSVMISGTSIPKWTGTGSVMISGALPLWLGTGSVMISGTPMVNISTGIGSVYIVDINGDNGIVDLGSPNYMRGLLTASGTYTNVWRQPPAGSRVEIHGFHISSNLAGYVRLCVSGTTPVVISDWNLNYASGATIEKTFVHPIIPGPITTPIGIGATVAGSTICTIYGREVK